MKHTLLPNQAIRTHAKQRGVRIYELADVLGVSQATITRRLRYELCAKDTADYITAIDRCAARHAALG